SSLMRKLSGRKAAQLRTPQPLVPHRTDAALHLPGVANAAESGGTHVAVFKGAGKLLPFVWIVTQPVQQFCETPFRGVHPAAPFDCLEPLPVGQFSNLSGFLFGPMIAP